MNKPLSKAEMQAEALMRAQSGESFTNYPAIFAGFMARGIPESEIEPRVNVLTYNAWQAKGRQVRRGEKSVKVVTFIVNTDEATGETVKRPSTAYVFHISQTDPIDTSRANRRAPRRYDNGDYVRDPGEDMADAWNALHGDR